MDRNLETPQTMPSVLRPRRNLLLLVALLTVTAIAPQVSAQENPYTTAVDQLMGQRTFRAQCGRCHGRDARGNDESGSPDLTGILDANTDQALFTVIREGIRGTAMIGINRRSSDQMVWQIVTYLNSFSIDPSAYSLAGDVARGRQVYNANDCASCHRLEGDGGRHGPDLTTIGERLNPAELRTSLTDPNETVIPRWWTTRVTRQDGSVIEGRRMDEDTFTVRLLDANENLWHFVKSDVRSTEPIQTSTMPAADDLTGAELDDLVAYLFSLRGQG